MTIKDKNYVPRVGNTYGPLLILFLFFTTAPAFAGQACGNAMLDFNEQCDDGNNDDGDGCSRTCEIEVPWTCTDPFLSIGDDGIIEDTGFEFGPGAAWGNDSNVGPIVCNEEECVTEPAGARNGVGWAQFGGFENEPFRLVQEADFDGNAQFISFDLKFVSCPSPSANDTFRVTINDKPVFVTGGSDEACVEGNTEYSRRIVNLTTAQGGPFVGAGNVQVALEMISFGGNLNVAVDNFVIGKQTAEPVPSICSLDPDLSLWIPYDDIDGELGEPDYQQKIQGEVPVTWGTTSDGVCGTAQNPPGNHTGQPGAASCIDSTFLSFNAQDERAGLASNVETYVCREAVDLSFKQQSRVQLVVNYQPGQITNQDFFGVWVGTEPFFGLLDDGIATARLLVNDPQGQFGQSPGLGYEIDINDLDGQPQVYVCFGYGNNGAGYAQVDSVFLTSDSCIDDFEEDKILGCNDNCTEFDNPDQRDSDNDGYGNACDADIARNASAFVQSGVRADNASGNDCLVNFQDLFEFSQAMFSDPLKENWNPDADFTGDNVVNFLDLARFSELFLKAPGPSGVSSTCSPSGT